MRHVCFPDYPKIFEARKQIVPTLQNQPGDETLQRSNSVDEIVLAAFDRAEPPVTVVAVGGYGRRELFPYSDVDLLLLTSGPVQTAARDRISEFLRTLWDAGLHVSQSVHTPAECCALHEGNLELTISLLDRRYLRGESSRYDQLTAGFPKFLSAQRAAIATHLSQMTRARHAKYSDTIYHLEPNVKEHPGGLRDLHVVHWLRKLKSFELDSLEDARDFLFSIRTQLHHYFRRDNNVLTFEAQEALMADAANSMRRYYRNARQLFRAATRAVEASEPGGSGLLMQFRDWRSRLSTPEFTVSRERVLLRHPSQIQSDPGVVGRLMQFVARHGVRLSSDTERRLSEVRSFSMSWSDFRELLALPHAATALRAMAELGLLAQLIPEWQRVDCLVVRDFYHRYTVDEHTLVAIQNLSTVSSPTPERADDLRRRFAALLDEVDHPELLRLALLLHDLGKGDATGDHAAKSTVIAREIMDRMQVRQEERDTVLMLIERHLDLSSIMTARDLSEAATARYVAERAGTIERLKLLTLLTYADISAVNPTAMTPWRLEQLWRVYRIGYDELTRELVSDRIPAPPEKSSETAAFLAGFPTRYVRTHTAAEIERHRELAKSGTGVDLTRSNGTYQLTVATPDRPFLLARISGALASFGFNILKAQAWANQRGQVLDTFIFSDPHRTLELNPAESERVRDTVQRAIAGKVDVAQLIGKRRRAVPVNRIQPRISFDNEASENSTLIEIVAEDRPGLLYDVTSGISSAGANIEVVLIDTEAHKALDVFYVTAGGRKLSDDEQQRLKTKLIQVCSEAP